MRADLQRNIYEKHLISMSRMKNCYWNGVDWTWTHNYVIWDALMKTLLIILGMLVNAFNEMVIVILQFGL